MTRVTAMLAWFDEPEDLLAQAVASAAVVADRVLAVDGGYRLRPDAAPASPESQCEAIVDAARAAGMGAEVIIPEAVWDGQVEKRDYMLQVAAGTADWLIPLDADWVFVGDRWRVRAELEAAEVDVLRVAMFTPYDGSRPLDVVAAAYWHEYNAGRTDWIDILMRVHPGMRVEDRHWGYSALIEGERRNLWGAFDYPAAERADSLSLRVEHRCFDRDLEQIEANRAYCLARDAEVALIGRET